ncbi:MAG: L-2-amino-thiazoline-4-carboxylic acid hydrolase [Spirochaetes bacterium]|nr:L-2-amino-thiazoline-4-carboxylic acid hydrolase [Spirochaetota bacterium]
MHISEEQLKGLARVSFARMDGAWFMAVAKKYGIGAAWDMDVEAWKQLSYVMGKHIRKHLIPDPQWPAGYLDAMELFMSVLGITNRVIEQKDGAIHVRVTDCDIQKGIAKAGIADCGIVTVETYTGMARGLFGKETDIRVTHAKNLNRGDDCCEVIIRRP